MENAKHTNVDTACSFDENQNLRYHLHTHMSAAVWAEAYLHQVEYKTQHVHVGLVQDMDWTYSVDMKLQ